VKVAGKGTGQIKAKELGSLLSRTARVFLCSTFWSIWCICV
jgi:hypothetical protein